VIIRSPSEKGAILMNTGLRRTAAGAAVLGAIAVAALVPAAAASATPTDFRCTSAQVTTTLTPGEPGAGQRYARGAREPKPGQPCNFQGSLPAAKADAQAMCLCFQVPACGGPGDVQLVAVPLERKT